MPEPLLTVDEVATWLRVNPQTVRNWLDRGELQGVRLGSRRVRIRQSDLDRFVVDSSTIQHPNPPAMSQPNPKTTAPTPVSASTQRLPTRSTSGLLNSRPI